MKLPTERFTSRVENYVKFRPGYPEALLKYLGSKAGLDGATVADIGSGPGNLTVLLALSARQVFGVEPNREMRQAGERALAGLSNFTSIDGSAEATGLADGSIDLITAGQAFHWFALEPTKSEFRRILRPGGSVALIWNERDSESDPFAIGYEHILKSLCREYREVASLDRAPLPVIQEFMSPAPLEAEAFENLQRFDWPGLRGRAESSSYFPEKGDADYDVAIEELHRLFEECEVNDQVVFRYRTRVYFARW